MSAGFDPPLAEIAWRPSFRVVPSRFPPVNLFDRVADPADLEAVIALESMTNPRLRQEVGELALVPADERIAGPGTGAIMAAFTHLNPAGSRFSDGSYGVFYAGEGLETAIAETRYHRARFMAATAQPRMELDMRVYLTDLGGTLHDIRGQEAAHPELYDALDYAGSQPLGRRLRAQGSSGIVYASVRRPDGECVAVFRPRTLSHCRQERHLCYVWDGSAIGLIYEKRLHV